MMESILLSDNSPTKSHPAASSGTVQRDAEREVKIKRGVVETFSAMHWDRSGYAIVFGGTVGAGLDYLHTHGDEIQYPEGTNHWRGIFTFVMVYWHLGWICAWINTYWGTHVPKSYRTALPHVVSYCLEYAFTAYGDLDSRLMAIILLCCGLYHWYVLDRTLPMMLAAICIAILGGSAESFLQNFGGTMTYTVQDIGGVPFWLPFIYFSGCTTWGVVAHRLFAVTDHMDEGRRGNMKEMLVPL